MPNPEVVNRLLRDFPDIRNELIPNYMKQKTEMDTEVLGEEESDELLPLDIWQQYKNTFEERIINFNGGINLTYANVQNIRYNQMENLYEEKSKHFYDKYDKHIITIPKNEFIGKLLT